MNNAADDNLGVAAICVLLGIVAAAEQQVAVAMCCLTLAVLFLFVAFSYMEGD